MLALGGGLAVLLILFGGLWIASLPIRDASLVDRFWGVAFIVLAAWYTGSAGP
jgi:steroid 5-alpha reductase family enzyme